MLDFTDEETDLEDYWINQDPHSYVILVGVLGSETAICLQCIFFIYLFRSCLLRQTTQSHHGT